MGQVRAMGAYQPRTRRATMADQFDGLRQAVLQLLTSIFSRGAGALLFLGAVAALAALASYSPDDASLNNATGRLPTNWLGGPGATAADLLLQTFGLASLTALAAPASWGAFAAFGRRPSHGGWRALAWPLGTILMAGGLGLLPAPVLVPAGLGGLIGLAAEGFARHEATAWRHAWIAVALPMAFLAASLPLAFLATGLRAQPIVRGTAMVCAFLWRAGEWIAHAIPRRRAADDGAERAIEDDSLEFAPEPAAAATTDSARATRVKRDETKKPAARTKPARQAALDLGEDEYQLPPLGLLAEPVRVQDRAGQSDDALEENARMLEAVLGDFGVRGRIVAVRPGPVVTLYEFEPAAGVKSSRVISLSDDVARSMSAVAARIAVIPGRNVLGIELPNLRRETVYLRELVGSGEYEKARAPLVLALGKTIGGEAVMADLAKMPHLLIAGTTGSGKSVALNTMILSLLYRLQPEQARMILIDPKMLELSVYEGIPHLLAPVVTDPRKAVVALKWTVREMEERYRKMSKLGVRGVEAFNERVRHANEKGETLKRTVQTGFDRESGKPVYEDETLELEP
ncbi:MAG TPA: DNA translocase FtsK 4TM domain-containing protein, partial [Rhizomicrobium sp.]